MASIVAALEEQNRSDGVGGMSIPPKLQWLADNYDLAPGAVRGIMVLIEEEREACAKIADTYLHTTGGPAAVAIGSRIRSRSHGDPEQEVKMEDREEILSNESRPGIEIIHLRGTPGYDDEELVVSNSLANGLRIEVTNEDMDWASFHIQSPATALLIAKKLTEWCARIADPPSSHALTEEKDG